mgnify:CR=1 FL=1|tara:strand:- start:841 stop:1119 length:279 start_codon:yes stop_codon:yes gene_type:complete
MWKHLVKDYLKSTDVDMINSFYCGDAVGRKGDFSNDDLLYSINLGLKFYTPEMLFKNEPLNFKIIPGAKIDEEFKKEDEEEKKSSKDDNKYI